MQVMIDETTARMAVLAMREKAERLRTDARSRRYSGPAFIDERARLRNNATIILNRASDLEATYSRKAKATA